MRKIVLLIIIILGGFSYGCYQKSIVPPSQRDQQRSDQKPASQERSTQEPSEQKLSNQGRSDQEGLKAGSETVTDTTNIHYNAKYCMVCHEQTPVKGNKFLKYGEDYKQLCRCHYKTTPRDIHPTDIEPTPEFKKRIPDDFPLRNGEIACITCHDVFAQCRDIKNVDTFSKGRNFLRGAPYKKLTTMCFKCHDKRKFERYNPHIQLDKNGNIIGMKCLYCHKKVPDVKKEEFKDVTLIGDLEPLCVRCHHKAEKQSLHARHLRKPSVKVLARIKQMEVEFGIVLPLDDNGKITCATCHNPHEKGVIPAGKAGAKGAGKIHRQRLTGNLCIQCHEM